MLHQQHSLTLTSWPSFFDNGSHLLLEDGLHMLSYKWQYPNNHPFCHLCGTIVLLLLQHKIASCSSSKLTILRASPAKFTGTRQTFQSPESLKHTLAHTKGSLQPDGLSYHIWRGLTLVSGTTFPFERINHAWSGMIYQALHQGLQHLLKHKFLFSSATVIKYFNMITSSPLFQESTHPGVASAICSTVGTTSYFSVSLSLLVLRAQVALHLNLWGQPIKSWSISVFILLIAISLAIHTPVHLYLAITSALGCSVIGLLSWPLHLLPRRLRPSWGGQNFGSYHGPHAFYPRCLCLYCHETVWSGLILWPAHLLS